MQTRIVDSKLLQEKVQLFNNTKLLPPNYLQGHLLDEWFSAQRANHAAQQPGDQRGHPGNVGFLCHFHGSIPALHVNTGYHGLGALKR